MTAPGRAEPHTALENLAAALDARKFAAILVTGAGHRPCLTVTSRDTLVAETVHAYRGKYWWSWAQPIAGTGNPVAAAHQVTSMLRAAPGAFR